MGASAPRTDMARQHGVSAAAAYGAASDTERSNEVVATVELFVSSVLGAFKKTLLWPQASRAL